MEYWKTTMEFIQPNYINITIHLVNNFVNNVVEKKLTLRESQGTLTNSKWKQQHFSAHSI